MDWPAAGLLAVVAAGLLLTAQHATGQAGARTTVIGAATTAAAAASLAMRQRTHPDQLLGRHIMSARWFRRAATTGASVYAGLFAGLLLLPGAVVGAALAWTAARLARRLPAGRVLAAVSLLLVAALCYAAADLRTWPVAAASTARSPPQPSRRRCSPRSPPPTPPSGFVAVLSACSALCSSRRRLRCRPVRCPVAGRGADYRAHGHRRPSGGRCRRSLADEA